jgi:hypothetical protein
LADSSTLILSGTGKRIYSAFTYVRDSNTEDPDDFDFNDLEMVFNGQTERLIETGNGNRTHWRTAPMQIIEDGCRIIGLDPSLVHIEKECYSKFSASPLAKPDIPESISDRVASTAAFKRNQVTWWEHIADLPRAHFIVLSNGSAIGVGVWAWMIMCLRMKRSAWIFINMNNGAPAVFQPHDMIAYCISFLSNQPFTFEPFNPSHAYSFNDSELHPHSVMEGSSSMVGLGLDIPPSALLRMPNSSMALRSSSSTQQLDPQIEIISETMAARDTLLQRSSQLQQGMCNYPNLFSQLVDIAISRIVRKYLCYLTTPELDGSHRFSRIHALPEGTIAENTARPKKKIKVEGRDEDKQAAQTKISQWVVASVVPVQTSGPSEGDRGREEGEDGKVIDLSGECEEVVWCSVSPHLSFSSFDSQHS